MALSRTSLLLSAVDICNSLVRYAVYNPFDAPLQPQQLLFAALGWPSGTKASIRDLWKHEDLGTFVDSYDTALNPLCSPHAAAR
jgi:hypothetical protein